MPPESPVKFEAMGLNAYTSSDCNSLPSFAGVAAPGQNGDNNIEEAADGHNNKENNFCDATPNNSLALCDNQNNPPPPRILLVDQISPGISSCSDWQQLGAEVQVENKIARRCSYEEMVHEDPDDHDLDMMTSSGDLAMSSSHSPSPEELWKQSALKITQWAITLQEIFNEREQNVQASFLNNKCLCHKATNIVRRLIRLENAMIYNNEGKINDDDDETTSNYNDHSAILEEVQSALRAGISIQISKPNEAVIELASTSLETALLSCDKVTYIKSAFESIVKHVNDLLNVPKCGHGTNSNLLDDTDRIRDVSPTRLMEQDEEEDIRIRVESMLSGKDDNDSEDGDDELEDEEEMEVGGTGSNTPRTARKRKQFLKKNSHQTGSSSSQTTASPSKRPRKLKSPIPTSGLLLSSSSGNGNNSSSSSFLSLSAPAKICQNNSPALDLLETKKKVQRNSLYHWVLWREALRGEKDRTTPRKLSFT